MKTFLGSIIIIASAATFIQAQNKTDSTVLWNEIASMEDKVWGNYALEFEKERVLHAHALQSSCEGCKGRSFYMLGKFLWADGRYKEALTNLHAAMRIAQKTNDYLTLADASDLIANTYYYQAYYDSAIRYFTISLGYFEKLNHYSGMSRVLNNTAMMYHRKGDFQKAIHYILRTEKLKDERQIADIDLDAFGGMGNLLIDTLFFREEIADGEKMAKTQIKTADRQLFQTYYNLANAHSQLKEYAKASAYFIKCCALMEKNALTPYWDFTAVSFRNQEKKDSCLYYHRKAIGMFKQTTQLDIAYTFELLGDSYNHFKVYDSAIYYYKKAFDMNSKLNNRITVVGLHNSLAEAYMKSGDFGKALAYVKQGLPLARTIALIHEMNLYQTAARIFERMGDYHEAFKYQTRFQDLKDSINREETALDLTRMQAEFKTAKKTQEVTQLQQQNLLKEAEIAARTYQVLLALGLLVIIGGIGSFFYYRYRKKKKSSDLLEEQKKVIEKQNVLLTRQNHEKAVLLHEIHHRIKNNLQFISSLINLQINHVQDEKAREALHMSRERIKAIGSVHKTLYLSDNLGTISFEEYLKNIINNLTIQSPAPSFNLKIANMLLTPEHAIPLGLILFELITNSIKHSGSTQLVITICTQFTPQGMELEYVDNGVKQNRMEGGFGTGIVSLLTRQLNGTEQNENYRYLFQFPDLRAEKEIR